MLLVVGIAALMLSVGLSMALGAFLAGVLLAETEYRRELETDIEPFKACCSGCSLSRLEWALTLAFCANHPAWWPHWSWAFCLQRRCHLHPGAHHRPSVQERPVFTLLLAQGGEFAFVVFQAAAGSHVFSDRVASLLIGSVAVSMLVSPLILVAIDRFIARVLRIAACRNSRRFQRSRKHPSSLPGFGRYGQIVGRLLLAQGFGATVLDHDADMIEGGAQLWLPRVLR